MIDLFAPPTLEELKERGLPPVVMASPEDVARAEEDRRNRPTRVSVKRRAEDWTKGRLERLPNAEVRKNRDELRQNWKTGDTYTVSTGVDFTVHVTMKGIYHLEVEAKGVSTGSFPLSHLSEKEREYLNVAARTGLGVISLVWYGADDSITPYWVPWNRAEGVADYVLTWHDVEYLLQQRVKGNYKGQSLRGRDLDLLSMHKWVKIGRAWQAPAWVRNLL